MEDCTCQDENVDTCGAGAQQRAATVVNRRPGGVDVIDQENTPAFDVTWADDAKCPGDVVAPFLFIEVDLWACRTRTLQRVGIEPDACRGGQRLR